ncbi:MAG: hypothetical protein ILA17_06270 [Ruminococcus sp.]|nr:hypothetical protein [Ruminococcus sp.]
MSDKSMARRAKPKVIFDGADISKDLEQYLLQIEYTDNDEDEADSLSIKVQDREGVWQSKWLGAMWEAGKALSIQAVISACNWNSDGADSVLDCGAFELDNVSASGPPNTINIKCTSAPYNCSLQQTEHSKSWESYDLKKIAGEIAGNAGMGLQYLPKPVPSYDRVEQYKTSDITFLKKLCQDAGFSVKVCNMIIVIFEQEEYEKRGPVRTFTKGDGTYSKYKLYTNETQTYALCRVYYDNDGTLIQWTQKAEDYDPKNNSNQKLEINQKVGSVEEAKALAKEMLRLYNKFAFEAQFTVPGDTALVSGATFKVKGFGKFDGKYLIKTAQHTVSGNGGYTTTINGQKALTDDSSGGDSSGSGMSDEQVEQLALEVIRGDWGAGQERKDKMAEAGYDYQTVQDKVNELIYR